MVLNALKLKKAHFWKFHGKQSHISRVWKKLRNLCIVFSMIQSLLGPINPDKRDFTVQYSINQGSCQTSGGGVAENNYISHY